MSKIYVNQPFRLELNVNQNIEGASAIIKVKRKNGPSTEQFDLNATIIDAEIGVIQSLVTPTINNIVGKWTVWAYITFANGDMIPGEPYSFEIYKEGC